jgi:hypothetical protein
VNLMMLKGVDRDLFYANQWFGSEGIKFEMDVERDVEGVDEVG